MSNCQAVGAEQELQRLELVVGRVIEVEDLLGSRGPSYRLTVDFGGRGRRETSLSLPPTRKDDLVGRQIVCALGADEPLVLAARSRGRGLVLLEPEDEVEDGSPVA